MGMVRISFYRHSVLANILTYTGSFLAFVGVMALLSGEFVGGAISAPLGVGMMLWGDHIARKAHFKQWWREATYRLPEAAIAESKSTMIALLQKCPERKFLLKKLHKLNPQLAEQITITCPLCGRNRSIYRKKCVCSDEKG